MFRWLSFEIDDYIHDIDTDITRLREQKSNAIAALQNEVLSLWPRASLEIYGSCYTHLGLPGSDVDCVVIPPNTSMRPVDMLRRLNNRITQKCLSWVNSVEFHENAKIPVLKVQYCAGPALVLLDVTCAHSAGHSGLQARDVIVKFMHCMPSLRPLVLVLKSHLFSRGIGINERSS
jgi:non-canonical poly(A) RNA polymerase PAPD5/7